MDEASAGDVSLSLMDDEQAGGVQLTGRPSEAIGCAIELKPGLEGWVIGLLLGRGSASAAEAKLEILRPSCVLKVGQNRFLLMARLRRSLTDRLKR